MIAYEKVGRVHAVTEEMPSLVIKPGAHPLDLSPSTLDPPSANTVAWRWSFWYKPGASQDLSNGGYELVGSLRSEHPSGNRAGWKPDHVWASCRRIETGARLQTMIGSTFRRERKVLTWGSDWMEMAITGGAGGGTIYWTVGDDLIEVGRSPVIDPARRYYLFLGVGPDNDNASMPSLPPCEWRDMRFQWLAEGEEAAPDLPLTADPVEPPAPVPDRRDELQLREDIARMMVPSMGLNPTSFKEALGLAIDTAFDIRNVVASRLLEE